jgi:hypothetical protein
VSDGEEEQTDPVMAMSPLLQDGVWVASLELGFIVTDAEFKVAKLARKLIVDNNISCMESLACMLFAIEAMIAEQIPGLTTRLT